MSNQKTEYPDHDEIMALLPWYVNNTLDEHQRSAVSGHIDGCDECQREIHFLETLNSAVNTSAENMYNEHADVDKSLSSIMDRIGTQSSQSTTTGANASWLQNPLEVIANFVQAMRAPQWSAAALAGVLAVVLGVQLYNAPSNDDYSVLSSPDINGLPIRLSVEISTTDNMNQIQTVIERVLERLGNAFDIDSSKDGVLLVAITESVDVTVLSKLITDLENEAQIQRVQILP